MNQILSTENNHKPKKTKGNELLDMRKVIIVFSVIIIVFAAVIIGAKVYGMIKESKNKGHLGQLNKPEITITKLEQNICRIEVTYDVGLDTVTYWWNDEDEHRNNNLHGSTTPFMTTREIPEGDRNVLHVKAIGIDGSVNEKQQEFVVEGQEDDPNKPKISWYHYTGTTKIDIMASSEKGMKSLSYNWEDEDPITIDATEENQKEIKYTIEAKRGTNKLYISAIDADDNISTKEGNIVGVLAPEIKFLIENTILKINIKHDMGFKKAIIKVNNETLIYDENNPEYDESTTELNIDGDVQPGRLTVEVRVYTLEEPDKEYKQEGYADIPG